MVQEDSSLINLPKLIRFLRDRLSLTEGDIGIERHEAGYSNETFFVSWGDKRKPVPHLPDEEGQVSSCKRWVLRRPPSGDLLPTAHDMLREYRVLSALSAFDVRTPQPVLACEDRDVLGVPFYLMQRVDGIVIRETLPEVFEAREERRRLGEELIDALAELHAVQWQGTDLEGIGRPQGYLERQLKRWTKQYELTVPHTRPLPGLEAVGDWLHQRLPPASEATVVHGDYKVDNVMFGVSRPARLVAIFDWEMATLGDPLSDLGWLLSFWGPTGDERDTPDLIDSNAMTQLPGFLSREEMAARYAGRTGRTMEHFPFYRCLAVWKYAIILEGLYRHSLEGTAANPKAAEFAWKVPQLVQRAQRIMAEAG